MPILWEGDMNLVCSTRMLTSDKRVRWQEIISELYAPLEIDIGDPTSFVGEISRTSLGPLELTQSIVDGEFSRRTKRHLVSQNNNDCVVVLVKQGPLTVSQFGRESDIGSGCYTILDLSEPYTLKHRNRTDAYFLKMAKPILGLRIRDVEMRCAVNRPGGTGVAAIGYDLIQSLGSHAATTSERVTMGLAEHMIDFFGIVFDTAGDGLVEGSSIACNGIRRRAARYIDRNLADPELSPEKVADALRISLRYLHRAFEGSGMSVNRHIRTQRLTRCRDALLRTTGTSQRISEISERYGFRNASHFSTCFKEEFGFPPSAVRLGRSTVG
ncbi:helix-turn-helix domain-containing protein [Bradyrhizobium erythrophlei]|uniref:helix-turn-helix domain-containing protein n=1 Tax=Bradyrhizobium erythrophlei TaxID=1437360 RepID=UPI0035EC5963